MTRSRTTPGLRQYQHQKRAWEVATLAPQVIATRMARMGRAGWTPGTADHAEMGRMVTEKLEAATEAALAMAPDLWRLQAGLMQSALRYWGGVAEALSRGIVGTAMGSHGAWRMPALPAFSPRDAATLMRAWNKGLAPVHRRVAANATRLHGR